MTGLRLVVALCLVLFSAPNPAAAPKPRLQAGEGILIIRPLAPRPAASTLTLFRDPGVGRITDMDVGDLPTLSPVVPVSSGGSAAVVTARQGEWLRIIYDDAGREGWIEPDRAWHYAEWQTFLKGKAIRPLAGKARKNCVLRSEPSLDALNETILTKPHCLRVVEIRGDWAFVVSNLSGSGWLRWRDGDGRFLVAIDGAPSQQNR